MDGIGRELKRTITKNTILRNETRKLMLDHIKKNPGIRPVELKKIFDLSDSTIFYHLAILLEFKFIKSHYDKQHNRKRYFPIKSKIKKYPFEDSHIVKILEALKKDEWTLQTDLVRKTGIPQSTISRKTMALDKDGIIIRKWIPVGDYIHRLGYRLR